jgi:hypothetical protein
MGQMQKTFKNFSLNVFRRLKISLKVNNFLKGDQLDLEKRGKILFLIRYCNLTGF